MTDKPKLRWYQYSLRSLFILTTLVACACSWYAYEMNEAAKRRAAIEEIGGLVDYYDAEYPDSGGKPPRWYSWLRKLHGDEHLGIAVAAYMTERQISEAGLVHLEGLRRAHPRIEYLGGLKKCGHAALMEVIG